MGTAQIDQSVQADDLNADGAAWEDLGTFPLLKDTLSVKMLAEGQMATDAVRLEWLGALPDEGNITVYRGVLPLPSGQSIDVGTGFILSPITETYAIRNTGQQELIINDLQLTSDLAITSDLTSSTLAPGEIATFTVDLTPTAGGSYDEVISIVSTDPDDSPFTLTLSGVSEEMRIIDDQDPAPEFVSDGTWVNYGRGYNGQHIYRLDGTGTATYVFSGLAPAKYQISGTWQPWSDYRTDVPVTVSDGSSDIVQLLIDQTVGPADYSDSGATWDEWGSPISLFTDTIIVTLGGTGGMAADAVRIDFLEALDPSPDVAVFDGLLEIADGGTTDFGDTPIGTPIQSEFTVRNMGINPLILDAASVVMPTGFSLAASFGSATLALGESTAFQVQFDAALGETVSGVVEFASNDPDESPFTFTVTAESLVGDADLIDDTTSVPDDTGVIDLGDAKQGIPVEKTLSVANVGTAELVLDATITMPTGFSLVSGFDLTTLAVGESASFTIRFDAESGGDWSGVMSFTSDDWNESPYDVTLTATVSEPDIEVLDGATDLEDEVSTVDFGQTALNNAVTKTLTVRNVGLDPLILDSNVTVPTGFSIATSFASTTLLSGESTTLDVQFDGTAEASGVVSIASNDRNEASFDITVTGSLTSPDITVSDNGTELTDGSSTVDFGDVGGTPTTRTITIQNDGIDPLVVGTITVPTGFALVGALSQDTLAAGETATFDIRFDAGPGAATGLVEVASNDPDENPFEFTVTGIGEAVFIVDNADAEFSVTGSWLGYSGGFNGRHVYKNAGSATATWTFSGLAPGQYQLAATYVKWSSYQTDAPYIISAGGTQVATVTLNQTATPNDFSDQGVAWENLGGVLNVSADTVSVMLDASGSAAADAIRLEYLGAIPDAPSVEVAEGATAIADGVGVADYGQSFVDATVAKTFTVTNNGVQDLILDGTINVPVGFTLLSGFGATTLVPGDSTTFEVQYDAAADGTQFGVVSFDSNAHNAATFDFTVSGDAVANLIIDNQDRDGFQKTGSWLAYSGGYNGKHEYKSAGDASMTWSFVDLPAGQYQLYGSWIGWSSYRSDAPYTVSVGGSDLFTFAADQRSSSSGFSYEGISWAALGGPVVIGAGTIDVTLSGSGGMAGDAIRLERLGGVTDDPDIDVRAGGTMLSSGSSTVDFGETFVSVAVTQSFDVANYGTNDLILDGGSFNLPAGYSLASTFADTTLSQGETTTFSLQFDADAAAGTSGTVTFSSNDPDEGSFAFSVTGSTINSMIVDDLDVDFWKTSAGWSMWNGGYGGRYFYKHGGDYSATYTFNGLPSGQYQVAAVWVPWSTYSNAVPIEVLDGGTTIGNATVNQTVAASGFSDAGVTWQDIGAGATYQLNGDTMVVRYAGAAGMSIDAIRIERVGDVSPDPEIQVSESGVAVGDAGTLDLGDVFGGGTKSLTFSIANGGVNDLVLQDPITVSSGLSLTSGFASKTLAQGESTTFTVELSVPSTSGAFSETIAFANNDPDEGSYELTVAGNAETVRIIDNSDAAFSKSGIWSTFGGGYQGNYWYKNGGTGDAVWSFDNVSPGRYIVSATWVGWGGYGDAVPFEVVDGGTVIGSAAINQRLQPDDFTDAGVNWENLSTGGFNVSGDSFIVRLTGSGAMTADAVRIEYAGPLPDAPEVDLLDSGTQIAVDGGVVIGSTNIGVPISKVLTVSNTGTQDLILQEPINLPTGFSLLSSFGSTTLAPNSSTTFEVQFDATGAGIGSGVASFGTNDADEGTYRFTVSAQSLAPEIGITESGVALTDAGSTVDFGDSTAGTAVEKTFTITNSGMVELTLGSVSVPTGFTLTQALSGTTLAMSETATFSVEFDAGSAGTTTGVLTVASNDSDENPFDITLTGTVNEPEIQIEDAASTVLVDGTNTVDLGGTSRGVAVTHTFTVTNLGIDNLVLSEPISVPTGFSVSSSFGSTTLVGGASTTFTLQFDATVTGTTAAGSVSVDSNDRDEAAFDFSVTGTIVDPEIDVTESGADVVSGSSIDFGTIPANDPAEMTFTVGNSGVNDLILEAFTLPAGVSVSSALADSTLAAGETTTFALQFDATQDVSAGVVSLVTNDPDENPFTLTVSGLIQTTMFVDNKDANFATTGGWSPYNGGFNGNYIYKNGGSATATWSLSGLVSGLYQVSTTYEAWNGYSTTVPYAINSSTGQVGSATVNQRLVPGDLTDNGAGWALVGSPVSITDGILSVSISGSAAMTADAIRIERVGDAVLSGQIKATVGGADLVNSGSLDFGDTFLATPTTQTVTLQNIGALDLHLTSAITLPAGFSLVADFGSTTLAPMATTTFEVQFDAATGGDTSGVLSFSNDDPAQSTFNITLLGTAQTSRVIDDQDGSPEFARTGSWTRYPGGYNGGYYYKNAGSGSMNWSFEGLPEGVYQLAVTYQSWWGYETSTPYAISANGTTLQNASVSQRTAVSGFSDAGVTWDDLGNPISLRGGGTIAVLMDQVGANTGDAIRIERVGDVPDAPDISISTPTGGTADGGSYDFGSTMWTLASSEVFTVRNVGSQDLILGSTINVPAGYTLVSGFTSNTLAPNEATTFEIQFDATTAGDVSGEISFTTNDPESGTYNFTATGTSQSTMFVDNKDTGFSKSAGWKWFSGHYGGDYWYVNTGAPTASWTFDNVPSGEYIVSTTFESWWGYMDAVPFHVLDDATEVGSGTVDQKVAASDRTDLTYGWADIGSTHVVLSGTLVVELRGSGARAADAVRIERVGDAPTPAPAPIARSVSVVDSSENQVTRIPRAPLAAMDATSDSTVNSLTEASLRQSIHGMANRRTSAAALAFEGAKLVQGAVVSNGSVDALRSTSAKLLSATIDEDAERRRRLPAHEFEEVDVLEVAAAGGG